MSEKPLRLDDFAGYDWQALVEGADRQDCSTYCRLFYARSRELAEAGDEIGYAVFGLLGDCTSPYLRSEFKDEPFGPMAEWGTSRTAIPSDIPDQKTVILPGLARLTRSPELQARIADIAWLRCRDHLMAQLAIDAYLDSGRRLDTDDFWPDAKDRVERALRLAAQLRRGTPALFDTVIDSIESVLAKGDASGDRRFQPLNLMELLIEFDTGDKARWSLLAESIAKKFEAESDWERAEAYWDTKVAWDRLRKDDNGRHAAQVRAAELREKIARDELGKSPPEYRLAAVHFQQAVERLRQAGESDRATALHREMLGYQELALGQMQSFREEMDISKYVSNATEAVRGQSLESALIILTTLQDPPSVASLRAYSERLGQDYVFINLFPTMQLNQHGRVTAVKPSRYSSDPAEVEAAIEADMFEHARWLHEAYAAGFIEPARKQVLLEHHVGLRNLRPIVLNNPLVAEGRPELVLRGLLAGLLGDFVVACHLLIPQIEHSIRHVLTQRGVITTSLTSEGIQEEQDLSRLLQRQETLATWGEDLSFDLRGLLVERFGGNLRNRLAHGLVHEREFDAAQCCYLWWIALRFYLLPILTRIGSEQSASGQAETHASAESSE